MQTRLQSSAEGQIPLWSFSNLCSGYQAVTLSARMGLSLKMPCGDLTLWRVNWQDRSENFKIQNLKYNTIITLIF